MASIQNARRIFGMSRKGYVPLTITQATAKVEASQYSLDFGDYYSLDFIADDVKKLPQKLPTGTNSLTPELGMFKLA